MLTRLFDGSRKRVPHLGDTDGAAELSPSVGVNFVEGPSKPAPAGTPHVGGPRLIEVKLVDPAERADLSYGQGARRDLHPASNDVGGQASPITGIQAVSG